MSDFDCLVVGGGAAGFFGALTAAGENRGLRIAILERGRRPLAKVLISGGGRCNVTHACFDPAALIGFYPRGARELRGPFTRFQPLDTIAWFEARDVPLKTEADGRVFPTTDRSQTIVDCLLREARRLGVAVRTGHGVRAVESSEAGFVVRGEGFEPLTSRRLLLAPGGGSAGAYRLAAGLGHTIVPPVPSLFTFKINDPRLEGLAGVSTPDAALSLRVDPAGRSKGKAITARGPLLVTHWGLSGPAVLRLSAWGARPLAGAGYLARLRVNWLPPENVEERLAALLAIKESRPRENPLKQDPHGRLPARLWRRLAEAAEMPAGVTWGELSTRVLRRLAGELAEGAFEIQGKGSFKEEFVTCGGVALREVNFQTMASRLCPDLFLAGEILDIDGLTGGFNFQSAWTTGWLAGRGAA